MRKLFVIITSFIAIYTAYYYIHYRQSKLPEAVTISQENHPSMGKGPIHMVVFQDFRCPGCKYFYDVMYPKLKDRYFTKNKVRYTIIPVAFLPGSKESAHMALAIHKVRPDYFFPYVENLYATYRYSKIDSVEDLLQKAEGLGKSGKSRVRRTFYQINHGEILRKNFRQAEIVMQGQVATPGIFVEGVDVSEYSLYEIVKHIDRKLWENGVE